MQKNTPFLWLDKQAEEAVDFYTSVFRHSRKGKGSRYGGDGPGAEGTVMTVTFQIDGQDFIALNGGPEFTFSPAISFVVNRETQDEIDALWETLSAGGEKLQCGWLKDKYGVSWQSFPLSWVRCCKTRTQRKKESYQGIASDGQARLQHSEASV